MNKTGVWIAIVGFLLSFVTQAFYTIGNFADFYFEEWYLDVAKAVSVVGTLGALVILVGFVVAVSGGGGQQRSAQPPYPQQPYGGQQPPQQPYGQQP
jgi:multisubunit Na+/H+ antiporter MnhG subunit